MTANFFGGFLDELEKGAMAGTGTLFGKRLEGVTTAVDSAKPKKRGKRKKMKKKAESTRELLREEWEKASPEERRRLKKHAPWLAATTAAGTLGGAALGARAVKGKRLAAQLAAAGLGGLAGGIGSSQAYSRILGGEKTAAQPDYAKRDYEKSHDQMGWASQAGLKRPTLTEVRRASNVNRMDKPGELKTAGVRERLVQGALLAAQAGKSGKKVLSENPKLRAALLASGAGATGAAIGHKVGKGKKPHHAHTVIVDGKVRTLLHDKKRRKAGIVPSSLVVVRRRGQEKQAAEDAGKTLQAILEDATEQPTIDSETGSSVDNFGDGAARFGAGKGKKKKKNGALHMFMQN